MNISAEFNQSCEEARLFGTQVLSDDVDAAVRYFSIGLSLILFPFSICLTSFTIFLILRFKHLRETTFLLAMQLIILSLVFIVIYTPLLVVNGIEGQWALGLPLCQAFLAIFFLLYHLRSWITFVFVCDRFFTVFMPFRYPQYRKKLIWSLYAAVLVITALSVIFPLALGCHSFDRIPLICLDTLSSDACPNSLPCQRYSTILVVFAQVTGSFIPLIMYIALFVKAKKVRNRIISVDTQENDGEQQKRDRRANVTFFALFLSLFVVNVLPLVSFIVVNSILVSLGIRPPEGWLVIAYLLQLLILTLPISDSTIVLRNGEVRKAITLLKAKVRARVMRNREVSSSEGITSSR